MPSLRERIVAAGWTTEEDIRRQIQRAFNLMRTHRSLRISEYNPPLNTEKVL